MVLANDHRSGTRARAGRCNRENSAAKRKQPSLPMPTACVRPLCRLASLASQAARQRGPDRRRGLLCSLRSTVSARKLAGCCCGILICGWLAAGYITRPDSQSAPEINAEFSHTHAYSF